jgi:hypothetical protein
MDPNELALKAVATLFMLVGFVGIFTVLGEWFDSRS